MSCKDNGATSPPPLSLLPARHDRGSRDCIRGNLGERVENGPGHTRRAAVRWPRFTAAERPACHEARRFVRRASLGSWGPLDGRRCGRRRRDQEKHEHGDRGDDQRKKRGTDSARQGPPPRRHRRLKLPRVVNRRGPDGRYAPNGVLQCSAGRCQRRGAISSSASVGPHVSGSYGIAGGGSSSTGCATSHSRSMPSARAKSVLSPMSAS